MVNPYLPNWDEWVEWFSLGPEATNWNEPAKYSWAVRKDKGNGQWSKGEANHRTDPGGMIFGPSAWGLKIPERAPV